MAADPGAVTVWLAAPPSDHAPKTYCTPVAPGCAAAASEWLDPAIHVRLHGVVHGVPSTATVSPAGALDTVTAIEAGALPAPSCDPTVTKLAGALWLLYSVRIQ